MAITHFRNSGQIPVRSTSLQICQSKTVSMDISPKPWRR